MVPRPTVKKAIAVLEDLFSEHPELNQVRRTDRGKRIFRSFRGALEEHLPVRVTSDSGKKPYQDGQDPPCVGSSRSVYKPYGGSSSLVVPCQEGALDLTPPNG